MEPPSFAAVVSNGSPSPPNPLDLVFPSSYQQAMDAGNSSLLIPASRRSGIPAIIIPDEDHSKLLEKLQHALVIKFLSRHPPLEAVRASLTKMALSGQWDLGQLDSRHLLIRFSQESDYAMLFGRRTSHIANIPAKVLKWTEEFDFRKEPPIVPIWVKLPGLKVHLFNHKILFSIASIIGKPLKLDHATFKLMRPSCAQILTEVDISGSLPKEIWLGTNSNGYKQQVEYEGIPYYCKHCSMFGHTLERCFHAHPELRPNRQPLTETPPDNLQQQSIHPPELAPIPPPVPQMTNEFPQPQDTLSDGQISPRGAAHPPILKLINSGDPSIPDSVLMQIPSFNLLEQSFHQPDSAATDAIPSLQPSCWMNPQDPNPLAAGSSKSLKTNVDYLADGETDPSLPSGYSSEENPLADIETELNEGWIAPRHRKKGRRELRALLRDPISLHQTSRRRGPRGAPNPHSS